jgi:hypothetical protein
VAIKSIFLLFVITVVSEPSERTFLNLRKSKIYFSIIFIKSLNKVQTLITISKTQTF